MFKTVECGRMGLCSLVLIAAMSATVVSVAADDAMLAGDHFTKRAGADSLDRSTPDNLPDIAELRASTDLRQKWRLGLLLADTAMSTGNIPSYFAMMAEAKSIALELAEIGMRDWLLAEIVDRQISAGDVASARTNVLLIQHPGWKAEALILFAKASPAGAAGTSEETRHLRDWAAAKRAVMQIPDDEWRTQALRELGPDS